MKCLTAAASRLNGLPVGTPTTQACDSCGRGLRAGDIVTVRADSTVKCKSPPCGPSPEVQAALSDGVARDA